MSYCKICQRVGAKWRTPAPGLTGWYVCDECHERTSVQLSRWVSTALAMIAQGRSIEQIQRELCIAIERGENPPGGTA